MGSIRFAALLMALTSVAAFADSGINATVRRTSLGGNLQDGITILPTPWNSTARPNTTNHTIIRNVRETRKIGKERKTHRPVTDSTTDTAMPTTEMSTKVMRKGSRLKMRKLGANRVALRETTDAATRATRGATSGGPMTITPSFGPFFTKHFSKRGQNGLSREDNYDTNAPSISPFMTGGEDSPAFLPYKYLPNEYSTKDADENNPDRYYYNDFGPVQSDAAPNTDSTWRLDEANVPDRRVTRFPPGTPALHGMPRPPYFERNACRQYLEFLRYAFEQLDNPPKKFPTDYRDDYNYYYYNDDDVYQGDSRLPGKSYATVPPPAIEPNMTLLQGMAKTTDNMYAGAGMTESAASKLPEANRRTPPSTQGPVTTTSSVPVHAVDVETRTVPEVTTRRVTQATMFVTSSTTERNGVPVFMVGASVGTTGGPRDEAEDGHRGGCDKLFPCPDNLNVTYPVNGYCNRFVECISGKPHPDFCQAGLHFNLVTRECDLPQNSFCTYSCPRANGYFGVAGHCEGFFRCSDWYPEYRMCPPRMHWDYKAKICTFEDLSSCPLKCDSPYEVKPYNGVCNSYIICTRGIPRYHRCPNDTHFDRMKLKCVPKSQSTCIDDEDYIARNRGIQNGREPLCATVELKDGRSKWCQETSEEH